MLLSVTPKGRNAYQYLMIQINIKKSLFLFGLIMVIGIIQAQKKDKLYTSLAEALKTPTQVTMLSLKGQGLKTLPIDIEKLSNVEVLDLSYNTFATVPVQIFKLPKLKILYLNNNALASLPDMSGLHSLTMLRLDANPFTNPLADLKKVSTISTLTTLNFSANKVSAFPDELLKLTNLVDLDLGFGAIKTLPTNIDKLQNLKRLVLIKNPITSFPSGFFNLPKLENLDLSYCDFKVLQPEFTKLHLNVIDVSYNKNLIEIPAIQGMRYANVKNTKVDIEKLKWTLGESCMIMM